MRVVSLLPCCSKLSASCMHSFVLCKTLGRVGKDANLLYVKISVSAHRDAFAATGWKYLQTRCWMRWEQERWSQTLNLPTCPWDLLCWIYCQYPSTGQLILPRLHLAQALSMSSFHVCSCSRRRTSTSKRGLLSDLALEMRLASQMVRAHLACKAHTYIKYKDILRLTDQMFSLSSTFSPVLAMQKQVLLQFPL